MGAYESVVLQLWTLSVTFAAGEEIFFGSDRPSDSDSWSQNMLKTALNENFPRVF